MHLRLLPALLLLSLPAAAQNKASDYPAAKPERPAQGSVPKGRQQPVERHTRTTWRYHSGPRRTAPASDSNVTKNQNAPDAVK